jgi:hypothetical protein
LKISTTAIYGCTPENSTLDLSAEYLEKNIKGIA